MEVFENISRVLTRKRLCQSEVLNSFFSLSDCIVGFGPFTVENGIRFFLDCFSPSFDGLLNVRSLIGKFGELHQIFRFKRVGLGSGKSFTPLDIGLKFVDFIGVNWIHVMKII
jgi:hypothetical protein